ncbi:tyrosine-type recombinase/integrase [Oleidesulfovibrio alaskensis]|jgi:integrase|uniref:tyrosine-type recombinase/integrase n=1 Tax=Oleidesulfovibrio alaskensis TaxID=58180 RepID=UPI0023536334|nr:site-specific integrase [Oleidesulfovibrio alaskensis]
MKRERTKFTGVYSLTSEKRRNPRDGKPDVCFYITYKRWDGRKAWEKVGWKGEGYTAALASEVRADRLKAMRHGDQLSSRKAAAITMDEAWQIFRDKWLPTLSRPQDEEGRYARHIAPALGEKRLDRITPLDIEQLKNTLLAKGLAPATVRLVFGDIRRVYRKLTEWDIYCGPIPTDKAKPPKVDNARTRFLTPDEANTLLAALAQRSRQWHDIAALSLHTGMRLGEILSLRGADVDLSAGVIHAMDAKAGTRAVILSDAAKAILQGIKPTSAAGYLFTDRNGNRLHTTGAGSTFKRVVKSIGLNDGITDTRQKVVFHTLRHTFCSWMVMRGVPLFTVGELVGHSTIEMTKRYSHLCPDAKRDALRHVGEMLNGTHGS